VLLLAVLLRLGSEGCSFASPLILATAYDAVVESYGHEERGDATREVILRTFTWVLALHVAGQALGFLSGFATGLSGERVVSRLRRRLYEHLLRQEMGFFDAQKSGDLVSRLGSDTLLLQQATTSSLNDFFIGLVKVVGGVTLMFIVSWQMTLIAFLSLLGWLVLVCLPGMRLVSRLTKQYQAALARASVASTESLGMMRTVRCFAAETLEVGRYQDCIGAPTGREWWPSAGDTTYRHGAFKSAAGTALTSSGFAVIFGALQVSVGVGFWLITYGQLQFGKLTAFQSYQMQIVMGIGQLASSAMSLGQAIGGATKIFQLLDREPRLPTGGGQSPAEPMRGEIAFEGVVFAFPTAEDVPVLRGFTLSVKAESTVALVGSSGCGKSTTLSLLLRFYDPQRGAITIDGHGVGDLDQVWLRSQMALVQQEPLLFGLSVEENVGYSLSAARAREGGGRVDFNDAAVRARVEEACRRANAHEFVGGLSDG